jgi:hypothetical protein
MNGPPDNIQLKEAEDWLFSVSPRLFDLYQRSEKDDLKNYLKTGSKFIIRQR